MHGIPGAGKSAFARQFSDFTGIAHINSDRIRYELYDDAQFTGAENTTVWRLTSYMAELLLSQGQSIIFDMHLPTLSLRKTLQGLAKENKADFVVVWVQTDYETALYRATHRDRRRVDDRFSFQLSPALHERLSRMGSAPNESKSIVVSGKHLFSTQKTPVIRKLRELNLLETIENSSIPAGNRSGRVDHDRRTPER